MDKFSYKMKRMQKMKVLHCCKSQAIHERKEKNDCKMCVLINSRATERNETRVLGTRNKIQVDHRQISSTI